MGICLERACDADMEALLTTQTACEITRAWRNSVNIQAGHPWRRTGGGHSNLFNPSLTKCLLDVAKVCQGDAANVTSEKYKSGNANMGETIRRILP